METPIFRNVLGQVFNVHIYKDNDGTFDKLSFFKLSLLPNGGAPKSCPKARLKQDFEKTSFI
jgi:hypothetical protein